MSSSLPESMLEFRVEDMSSEHCVDVITKAVQAVDEEASVEVDLAKHIVRVETEMAAEDISEAISEAGYTPVMAPQSTY